MSSGEHNGASIKIPPILLQVKIISSHESPHIVPNIFLLRDKQKQGTIIGEICKSNLNKASIFKLLCQMGITCGGHKTPGIDKPHANMQRSHRNLQRYKPLKKPSSEVHFPPTNVDQKNIKLEHYTKGN